VRGSLGAFRPAGCGAVWALVLSVVSACAWAASVGAVSCLQSSMTKCCSCKASGVCKACKCQKRGVKCCGCAPGGRGGCANGGNRALDGEARLAGAPSVAAGATSLVGHPAVAHASSLASATSSGPTGVNYDGAAMDRRVNPVAVDERPAYARRTYADPDYRDGDDDTDGDETYYSDEGSDAASLQCTAAATVTATPAEDVPASTPAPVPSSPPLSLGEWGVAPKILAAVMDGRYDEVLSWRRNLFLVPLGSAGAGFVRNIAALIGKFADGGEASRYAWSAVVVSCHLLLQKPFKDSKASDHAEFLKRRLELWNAGNITPIFEECRCIQDHLPPVPRRSSAPGEFSDLAFANMVFNNKIGAASRYLGASGSRGVLSLGSAVDGSGNKTVLDVLHDKHPPPVPAPPEVKLDGDFAPPDPVMFEEITPAMIRRVALRMTGSAGPSGVDAAAWKRMVSMYKTASDELVTAMARAAKLLCTRSVDAGKLEAYLAARLIPLDKDPGVRPIAVGEVFRRIIGRAVMKVIESDVMKATAPLQLCIGIPSACEVAVESLTSLFRDPGTEAVLLVDASNAFNAINRALALHNIPRVCPAAGQIFINTYQNDINLYIDGGTVIKSREGTCQGDPLAMAFYALATMPLIRSLAESCPGVPQQWYADDDAAAGSVQSVRRYWSDIGDAGPCYGYHPNPRKSILLVKPQHEAEARLAFADTDVAIRTDGVRYLGGCIGTEEFATRYIAERIQEWTQLVLRLASVAATQPHAAYTVMVQAVQSRWLYLQRVWPMSGSVFQELDKAISEHLLPTIMGQSSPADTSLAGLLSLPVRNGGLGIFTPSERAASEYAVSHSVTAPLVATIVDSVSSVVGSVCGVGGDGSLCASAAVQSPPVGTEDVPGASAPRSCRGCT